MSNLNSGDAFVDVGQVVRERVVPGLIEVEVFYHHPLDGGGLDALRTQDVARRERQEQGQEEQGTHRGVGVCGTNIPPCPMSALPHSLHGVWSVCTSLPR